jgi:hypothetical protein
LLTIDEILTAVNNVLNGCPVHISGAIRYYTSDSPTREVLGVDNEHHSERRRACLQRVARLSPFEPHDGLAGEHPRARGRVHRHAPLGLDTVADEEEVLHRGGAVGDLLVPRVLVVPERVV